MEWARVRKAISSHSYLTGCPGPESAAKPAETTSPSWCRVLRLFSEQMLLPYKMLCPSAQSRPRPSHPNATLPSWSSKCLWARTWHLWIPFPLARGRELRSPSHSEEQMAGDILCAHFLYRSGCTFGRRWLELTFASSHVLRQMSVVLAQHSYLFLPLGPSTFSSSLEVETTGVKEGFNYCRLPTSQNTIYLPKFKI